MQLACGNVEEAVVAMDEYKSFHNFLRLLYFFLEPLFNILAWFIDQGYLLGGSLTQWFKVRVTKQVPSHRNRRLKSSDLKSGRFLGQGCSGIIYEATWSRGRIAPLLARKAFPAVPADVFEYEVARLVELYHPNIVKTLGWTVDRRSCSLVMDRMKYDLFSVVEKRKEAMWKEAQVSGDPLQVNYSSAVPFPLHEAVNIMLQIAIGMEYVHDKRLAHGDLKPKNVLVDSETGSMLVKIADFGLTETKRRSTTLVSHRARCLQIVKWKAPELFEDLLGSSTEDSDNMWTEKFPDLEVMKTSHASRLVTMGSEESKMQLADIYSFALTCSYLLGARPWYSNLGLFELQKGISSGARPHLPPECPEMLASLISSCWDNVPSRRPAFFDICKKLRIVKWHLKKRQGTFARSSSYCPSDLASDLEPVSMNFLPEELLKSVFRRLPLFDTLRARSVCKRWLAILTPLEYCAQFRDQSSSSTVQSWCPLVFKRTGDKHEWCGYDSTTSTWQPMPSLVRLPQVDIRPLTGNGKAVIGYKITTAPSQVVVGNPITSTWQTIPNSTETWGEVGNILLVDREDSASFQIIAVREEDTEIFHSSLGVWTKLRHTPAKGVCDTTVLSIKDKLISATPCGGLLFCYGVHPSSGSAILVSFDVQNERWTDDCIPLPPPATSKSRSKCFQMVECGGNLFAAVEDAAKHTIAIWGLGRRRRKFFGPMVEMPQELYVQLCMTRRSKPLQLKAVGHQHRMFFWRNIYNPQTLCIVVFDFLLRTWAVVPEFALGIGPVPSDAPDDLQIFVDAGSFEP